jgi:hypothetical protein
MAQCIAAPPAEVHYPTFVASYVRQKTPKQLSSSGAWLGAGAAAVSGLAGLQEEPSGKIISSQTMKAGKERLKLQNQNLRRPSRDLHQEQCEQIIEHHQV